MWFIRRMLRISWTEKKTNVNVLREGNVQRSLLKTIRKRQMEFLGHVCRRRGLEFLSLTGKVEGKRDRGKQRITFLDSLCNSATGGQSKDLNFLKLSDDRDVWRGMVANVCSRSGTWWWWWWWWVNTSYLINRPMFFFKRKIPTSYSRCKENEISFFETFSRFNYNRFFLSSSTKNPQL